jgi:hypothetical protein
MTGLPTNPFAIAARAGLATYLMTTAGVGLKKLRLRVTDCPVCHHPREHCTCRWL